MPVLSVPHSTARISRNGFYTPHLFRPVLGANAQKRHFWIKGAAHFKWWESLPEASLIAFCFFPFPTQRVLLRKPDRPPPECSPPAAQTCYRLPTGTGAAFWLDLRGFLGQSPTDVPRLSSCRFPTRSLAISPNDTACGPRVCLALEQPQG